MGRHAQAKPGNRHPGLAVRRQRRLEPLDVCRRRRRRRRRHRNTSRSHTPAPEPRASTTEHVERAWLLSFVHRKCHRGFLPAPTCSPKVRIREAGSTAYLRTRGPAHASPAERAVLARRGCASAGGAAIEVAPARRRCSSSAGVLFGQWRRGPGRRRAVRPVVGGGAVEPAEVGFAAWRPFTEQSSKTNSRKPSSLAGPGCCTGLSWAFLAMVAFEWLLGSRRRSPDRHVARARRGGPARVRCLSFTLTDGAAIAAPAFLASPKVGGRCRRWA